MEKKGFIVKWVWEIEIFFFRDLKGKDIYILKVLNSFILKK